MTLLFIVERFGSVVYKDSRVYGLQHDLCTCM